VSPPPRGAATHLLASNCERQHAHADQVRAVDALEALGDDAFTPSSIVPLAAQSREEPVPYSSPARTTSGTLLGLVAHRRVVDRQLLARRLVLGDAALDAGHHQVLQADVGEGAAHHHLVVAAARAVLS
jgi:hypothetical protein